MLDLVIRRGLVVTAQDAAPGDVGILDGKIVAVASPGSLPGDAARVIDAEGRIVLPGGIEPHAHIAIPVPQYWGGRPELLSQPPEAATRAALRGATKNWRKAPTRLPRFQFDSRGQGCPRSEANSNPGSSRL